MVPVPEKTGSSFCKGDRMLAQQPTATEVHAMLLQEKRITVDATVRLNPSKIQTWQGMWQHFLVSSFCVARLETNQIFDLERQTFHGSVLDLAMTTQQIRTWLGLYIPNIF